MNGGVFSKLTIHTQITKEGTGQDQQDNQEKKLKNQLYRFEQN